MSSPDAEASTGEGTARPSRSSRRQRLVRRLAIATLLVLASLLLAEGASRALMRALGRPYDEEQARTLLASWVNMLGARVPLPGTGGAAEDVDLAESGFSLQPYVAWQVTGFERVIAADAAYYRSAESQTNFDICVLGGSVANIFATLGGQRLSELLGADPRFAGRNLRVSNYACPGYKQPQQVLLLTYLLNLGHAPDAVIEIDGFNEVALGNNNVANRVHPLYPSISHWAGVARDLWVDGKLIDLLHAAREQQREAVRFGRSALASGSWRSCVLGHVSIYRLRALRERYLRAHQDLLDHLAAREDDPVMRGPQVDTSGEQRFVLAVHGWEESSRLLDAICREHTIPYLHVLQPTLHDAGSKPLSERELAASGLGPVWEEGARIGYPLLRAAGERLRARGVSFFDASGLFRDVEEDLYYDGCHFGARGNELLAETIARAFLAAAR